MSTTWIPRSLRPAPDSLWRQMQRTSSMPRLHLFNVLWSLWVLATLFFAPVDAAFWWSLGIGYPLFVLLFALVHVRPHEEIRVYAGLMALLAFVSMFWNPAAWSYAVFACVYTGMALVQSPRAGVLRIVMIQAVLVLLAWLLHWPWFIMVMAVSVCTSASIGAMFGYMTQMRNLELRQSHEEIRRLAASNERERIGRDLHDLLGHTLSLITLKLELSRKLFDRDPERARSELDEAEKVARQALAEVRAAVTGIRATGLAGELASARLMLGSSGVSLSTGTMPPLPDAVDDTLALALRESVTNIHRHASASHASVDVEVVDGRARMRVRDDGRGGVCASGNGLNGMRERIEAMAGSLRIHSLPGAGTELAIDIPLPASAQVPAPSMSSERNGRSPADAAGLAHQAGLRP